MTGVAVQTLDRSTGEVVTSERFDFGHYMEAVGPAGLNRQQQLAAAYDKACAALIGPNDVQVEGARTFKKKSAWRKLARHFGISTSVIQVSKEWLEGSGASADDVGIFLATVTVRASAPWGQSAEAVGACGTDEETGRRTITRADAIATAETRATNRAISNLIAMGEVSAEEMNKERGKATRSSAVKAPADKLMPFGKLKGLRLGEISVEDLNATMVWCQEKDAAKFKDLIAAIATVVQEKGAKPMRDLDEVPEALDAEDDDLPF